MALDPLGGLWCTTCPAALNPTSMIRRASAQPCVPWLRTHWEGSGAPCVQRLWIPPPDKNGSRPAGRAPVHRVSCGFESCLPVGRAPGCRTSCGSLWAAGLKHKEKPSRPARAARLTCSQCTCTCFQGARHQSYHGSVGHEDRQCIYACKTCRQEATVRLQRSVDPTDHT
jgi:hypothetical protein